MIKKSLVLCLVLTSSTGFSQTVVATQGDHYENANGSISFTVGEVVINTGTDGSNDLTQGFHQTNWNFVGLDDYAADYTASVYPNPSSDVLNIEVSSFENVQYAMYDASGRLVLSGTLSDVLTSLQVGALEPGSYNLTLSDGEQNQLKNFKLIKH
ncbi:MAG: T9SS type A sorting domain-containing protein [bacterium]|nr:T9SS type A sorting domain-containing protein [bacterium]